MKYSICLKYINKSPYPYYVVHADVDLTKFHVWSKRKLLNAWLYTEQEAIAMIEERYPGAERVERVDRSRSKQVLTHKKPYPAKQELTPAPSPPRMS
jgi:alkylated DNA repair dioxygenase AlkB